MVTGELGLWRVSYARFHDYGCRQFIRVKNRGHWGYVGVSIVIGTPITGWFIHFLIWYPDFRKPPHVSISSCHTWWFSRPIPIQGSKKSTLQIVTHLPNWKICHYDEQPPMSWKPKRPVRFNSEFKTAKTNLPSHSQCHCCSSVFHHPVIDELVT